MNTQRAVVVLSGGQDSTTSLFWAKRYFKEVHAITFNYNQRHNRELDAAAAVARLAEVPHRIVNLGPILAGRSPLTNPNEQLETYENHAQMEKVIGDRVELTFVPMRNALFLTLAANHATCLDTNIVVTGVCQADNANYPDCRRTFIDAQERATMQALGIDKFEILTPLMDLSKQASINLAQAIGCYETLAFTHTAYDGQYPPVGNDHASVLRAYGFEQAGLPDPLVLKAAEEGLCLLPNTINYANMEFNREVVERVKVLATKLEQ